MPDPSLQAPDAPASAMVTAGHPNPEQSGEFGTVQQWRKKPVAIEAIKYNPPHNCSAVAAFVGQDHSCSDYPAEDGHAEEPWLIETLEGVMEAAPGDFIIKGVKGEFYPCKPYIFEATYEAVEAVVIGSSGPSDG